MPIVGFSSKRSGAVRAILIVRNELPIGSESDSVAPILIIVSMLVDDMEQIHRFLRNLMIVKGESVLGQSFHYVRHRIQLLGRVDDVSFAGHHEVITAM